MFNVLSLEVKDEILSGEPLYVIKDSSGSVLFDNVKLELKTPTIQEGTPLNKVLFDKIDYIGECVSYISDVGNDFEKFVKEGEFMGLKLPV